MNEKCLQLELLRDTQHFLKKFSVNAKIYLDTEGLLILSPLVIITRDRCQIFFLVFLAWKRMQKLLNKFF